MLAMGAVANLQYSWTLFTTPLTEHLGVKLSVVQVAFSLFVIAQTWLVPVDGYLIDKLGARTVVTAGGVLVGAGWIGAGAARSLGALYFWYTIGGVGAGAVYGAAVATAYCRSRDFMQAASYRKVDRDEITGAAPSTNGTSTRDEFVAIECLR